MTIQELIDKLQQVRNKNRDIFVNTSCINGHIANIESISSDDSGAAVEIHLSDCD